MLYRKCVIATYLVCSSSENGVFWHLPNVHPYFSACKCSGCFKVAIYASIYPKWIMYAGIHGVGVWVPRCWMCLCIYCIWTWWLYAPAFWQTRKAHFVPKIAHHIAYVYARVDTEGMSQTEWMLNYNSIVCQGYGSVTKVVQLPSQQ
jgi:hypothetical protein